jgi:hypothetical protein
MLLDKWVRGVDALRNLTPLQSMLDTALLADSASAAASSSSPLSLLSPLLDRLEVLQLDHESLRRGVVGELLHAEDAALVQLTPLRRFYPGEMVAWKDSKGEMRYGQVVKEEQEEKEQEQQPAVADAQNSSSSSSSSSSNSGGASSAAAPLFSPLLIRIQAHKLAPLSSGDIYSFASHTAHSSSSLLTGAEAEAAAERLLKYNQSMMQRVQQLKQRQEAERAQGGQRPQPEQKEQAEEVTPALIASATAASAASASSSSSSSSCSSSSLPLDRSRVQLLSAVSSLLQQAHLPLSLESESLALENLTLRQQAAAASSHISAGQARESQLQSELEKVHSAFTCPVCCDSDVDCLWQCGHFTCTQCEQNIRAGNSKWSPLTTHTQTTHTELKTERKNERGGQRRGRGGGLCLTAPCRMCSHFCSPRLDSISFSLSLSLSPPFSPICRQPHSLTLPFRKPF